MKNSLIPPMGAASAPILGGILLRNPFLEADIEIRNHEPALAGDVRQGGVGASAQVLRVAGYEEMTAANCNQFRNVACAAWHGQTEVEIDMSETRFIDCAGLGALIALRNLTHKGVARLMNPASSVLQMLELTRTEQLFDIVNSPDTGLVFGPAAHN